MNSLRQDLTGQVVIFKQNFLKVPAEKHPFLCQAGFGLSPDTQGTAISGVFLSDNESTRMEGFMVERLATTHEVVMALLLNPNEREEVDRLALEMIEKNERIVESEGTESQEQPVAD